MAGKYLANLHLNKTICAYIINNYCSEASKIQYLKRSARRGTSVCSSMFKFIVNEAYHIELLRCMEGENKIIDSIIHGKIKVGNRYDPNASYHRIRRWYKWF